MISLPQPNTPDTELCLSKNRRWVELMLVLFLALAWPLLGSTYVALYGSDRIAQASKNLSYIAGFLQELGALLVLFYILRISGRTMRTLGLRLTARSFATGLLLTVGIAATYYLSYFVVQLIHRALLGTYVQPISNAWMFTGARLATVLPFLIINPFFEEIIFRGYVITELSGLTGSTLLAGLASVVIQTSYHAYQGWLSATALFLTFSLLTVYYIRTRRLLPVIVAHALADSWIVFYVIRSGAR